MAELSWFAMYYNYNAKKIMPYNVLGGFEGFIKKQKKKCLTKNEFSEVMRREFVCKYWSRCEWELIIERSDGRILLRPWTSSREDSKKNCIDVTDRSDFNWVHFANYHIGKQIFKDVAKIDIYSQISWKWDEFIDYCWYTRLKYQRNHPKFQKQ